MLDIKITRTTCPKEKPQDETKLGFGKKFTDHMFVMDYTEGEGWHDARIVPYAPFQLDPATVVFHYAQEIFEGMKAYRTANDTIQLFRPDCNAKRMQDSADRLCIPKIPVEDYIQAVEALVDVDRDWVPHADGASLYIRPFVFANDVGLGVHASKHYIFCIICAPSGAYYAEGINPVRIYVEDEYIRAAPGLTGFTKCGGNYAASIKAGELAEEQGYAQVLWLDGVEKKYVEEVGSMNIMFKIDGKVYTAATVGTVLPGVTRRSCIELLKDWGYDVIEGKLAIADIMQADIPEAARAAGQMIKTGLADNADEAFDILVAGYQNGADASQDLLDTFGEYSTHFRDLGLSGQEATALLIQGLEGGAFNADKVADSLKELTIKVKELDTTAAPALEKLGLSGKEMQAAFTEGGPAARDALDEVIKAATPEDAGEKAEMIEESSQAETDETHAGKSVGAPRRALAIATITTMEGMSR